RPEATANAAIASRLPYRMVVGRFAHYLKVMVRDKVGSMWEASEAEAWLNRWIQNYVNPNVNASPELKARNPLREARIVVEEAPEYPGVNIMEVYLRPWLPMEELTTSMRSVMRIPSLGPPSA